MKTKKQLTPIEEKLQSRELFDFIKKRLEPLYSHDPDVLKLRRPFDKSEGDQEEEDSLDFLDIMTDSELTEEDKQIILEKTLYRYDSFIAGGAVANLIFEYIYGVPAAINDVDFFFYNFHSPKEEHVEGEIYERLSDAYLNKPYRVVKVLENKDLNKIKIIPANTDFTWKALLLSFDLNNCQAGMNLSSEQIVYTEEFLDFLNSKEIKLSVSNKDQYPLSTFVRGVIKSKESGCPFYHYDYLRNYLLFNLYESYFLENQKYIKLVNRVKDIPSEDEDDLLDVGDSKIIQVKELITKKRQKALSDNPTLLNPVFAFGGGFLKVKESSLDDYPWFSFFKSISPKNEKGKNLGFNWEPHRGVNAKEFINQIKQKHGHPHLINKSALMWLLNQNGKVLDRIHGLIGKHLITTSQLIDLISHKENLFKQDYSLKILESIDQFCKDHSFQEFTFRLLIKHDWDFNKVLYFLVRLKSIPLSLLGVLEAGLSTSNNYCDRLAVIIRHCNTEIEFNQGLDLFFREIESEWKKKIDKDRLCPLIPLPGNFIKHLTLQSELTLESNRMKHCVSGYGAKVKSGESLIFHIQTEKESSTIEIQVSRNKKEYKKDPRKLYKNIQHRGNSNATPSVKHQTIAKHLVRYLNLNCGGYFEPPLIRVNHGKRNGPNGPNGPAGIRGPDGVVRN